MKSKLCISFLSLTFVSLIVFFACNKPISTPSDGTTDLGDDTGKVGIKNTPTCAYPPDYGDSIIYTKYKGPNNDYTIKPKNDTVAGKFFAWPQGLVIDSATGEINVTQSETGERYNIGFIKQGTQDTCVSQLIIAGVTYIDSIYVLDKNDTLAKPIYNANPNTPPVCDNSADDDYPPFGQGNAKCYFDDGGAANGKGVKVRTVSGIINLKKTITDGTAFGTTTPVNGQSTNVKIQYRLNDASSKAMQQINVQLVYYENLSDVPTSLQNEISTKRQNFFDFRIVNGKPRPPLLLIVLHNN
jgi:hypothetical protein